jgi:peptide/nickel transport system substrate-binding protein
VRTTSAIEPCPREQERTMYNPKPSRRRPLTRRELLRRGGLLAAAAAAAPLAAACSANGRPGPATTPATRQPVRGGTLTVRLANDASLLDPTFSHDVYSNFVTLNCVETLLALSSQAQPVGLLAQSWENPDPQTYIFKLRQGVQFQDGTPLNATAVAYSLNRTHDDKTAFSYADLTAISAIETPDAATVKVSLSAPFAPFLMKLTNPVGCVFSPATAEKQKDKLKTDITGLGSGPFSFVEWKPQDRATLARNPGYWAHDGSGGALPYLDKIIARPIPDATVALASLRNGEIDGFRPNGNESPPPQSTAAVMADKSLSLESAPGVGYNYIVFNEAKAPFTNKAFRQAVSCAIDRAAIAKTVWFDTVVPQDVIFGPTVWAADPDYHPYLKPDVARAKQLLAQGGAPNGFSFTLMLATGSPVTQQAAELIKDQLSSVGIQMTIQAVEFATLTQALTAGQHQAGFLGWSASYEPDDWVYNHFSTKGSLNVRSHYSNADVDRLLDQARTTLETKQRAVLYQQAQHQIIDDAVFCVLNLTKSWSLSTNKVNNYPIGPTTPVVGVPQTWKMA